MHLFIKTYTECLFEFNIEPTIYIKDLISVIKQYIKNDIKQNENADIKIKKITYYMGDNKQINNDLIFLTDEPVLMYNNIILDENKVFEDYNRISSGSKLYYNLLRNTIKTSNLVILVA